MYLLQGHVNLVFQESEGFEAAVSVVSSFSQSTSYPSAINPRGGCGAAGRVGAESDLGAFAIVE